MVERQVSAAVMEVSSHALALGRVAGTSFEVAVFTNLSQDHLDFHRDMDSYFAAKAELFTPRYARSAVVNVDDPRGRELAEPAPIPVTTYSAAGRSGADWRAADVRCGADGSTFQVIGPGGVEADASIALPGPFNVANALAAIVALVETGVDLGDSGGRRRRHAPACPAGSSGSTDQDLTVLVDYSHKPGAVEAVLTALRPVTAGQPADRARLRRRPGRGQAPADGCRRRRARRRRDLHQRQSAVGGPAGDPRRDAGGHARRCRRATART